MKQMGKLDTKLNKRCYLFRDRLTMNLSSQSLEKEMLSSQPIALDFLFDIHLVSQQDPIRQGNQLLAVSASVRDQSGLLRAEHKISPIIERIVAMANELANTDPVAQQGKAHGYKPPETFVLQNNPPLNGCIGHPLISGLHEGVGALEMAEPRIASAALLYLAVKSFVDLALRWSDMNCLIDYYSI